MQNSRRYTPTNSKIFTSLIRNTYGRIIRCMYHPDVVGNTLIKTLEPPYVLVSNHAMLLDPFMINALVPQPIHWVASDGNMRNPVMRFLLIRLVGSIPKSKAIPDIETVNWMVDIIRKQKGVVGFFPEGQTSWNGSSIDAYGSTAKLIKLLKVPVLGVTIRGGYLAKSRWSRDRRRGKLELDFHIMFSPEEIKSMKVPEIDRRLNDGITHDDPAWADSLGLRYRHPRRAESLELALYLCPSCGKIATLESRETKIYCKSCGMAAEFGEDAHFTFAGGGLPAGSWAAAECASPERFFERIIDWDRWQERRLREILAAGGAGNDAEPVMIDDGVRLYRGKRMDTMTRLGKGRLSLYRDALLFQPVGGGAIEFPTEKIEGPGVLKKNLFEFYVSKSVYRARFADQITSDRKWAVALDILADLRRERGENAPK